MYNLVQKRQRNQKSNCQHSLGHRESEGIPEIIYFLFIDYTKTFNCVDHKNLWNFLKRWQYHHLICLLRNLYAGQEASVRTGYDIADWFKIGKGVSQGCILSPCLFNFFAEYIMQNADLKVCHCFPNTTVQKYQVFSTQ